MRFQLSRYFITTMISVLMVVSGAIGFQFGQPSTEDIARQLEELSQDVDQVQIQVRDLSLYAGRDMSWIAEESESAHLWIYLAIPASEYQNSPTGNACDGYTNLSPSNLGVADSLDNPLVWPSYGIYLGTSSFEGTNGDECIREYFFPNIPRSRTLYFAEWFDTGGMRMTSYYWEIAWADIDWEDPFLTIRP